MSKTTPKDFFIYIAAMVTLYVSAGSLLALLFNIADALFPDPLAYADYYSTGIRFAIASLIIVFPLYITLTWLIRKDIILHPEKREIGVRRWLVYMTLFVAGAVVAGDLIALLNTFLGGELTARFISKIVAVLVVSGAVFTYYFYDLKRIPQEGDKPSRQLAISVCILVVAILVWGFTVMGSPSTARKMRFDERRVNDLSSIQWQAINYWQQKGVVPESLDDLTDPISGFIAPTDPDTGDDYKYLKTGNLSFELCANFGLSNEDSDYYSKENMYLRSYGTMPALGENWTHPVGDYCFERTIDKDLYSIDNKTFPPNGI